MDATAIGPEHGLADRADNLRLGDPRMLKHAALGLTVLLVTCTSLTLAHPTPAQIVSPGREETQQGRPPKDNGSKASEPDDHNYVRDQPSDNSAAFSRVISSVEPSTADHTNESKQHASEYNSTKPFIDKVIYGLVFVWNGFLEHSTDWLIVIFTGLLTTFTWRLSKSTKQLWEAGEKQSKLTRDSVELAEMTAERQLRAYISLDKVKVTQAGLNMPYGIQAVVTNTGQTPAYDLSIDDKAGVASSSMTSAVNDQQRFSRRLISVAGSGWTAEISKNADGLMSGAKMDQIRSGTSRIYYQGEIRYKDAFEKERTLKFCLYADDVIMSADRMMRFAEEGNEAD